jgi:uncharacterized protein (TIGR00299 family) protein
MIGLHAWVDASAGVAGDMLMAALVDAGADLAAVQRAVDAVVPDAVELTARSVSRAGTRALKVDVRVLVDDPPHRTWRTISGMLMAAELPKPVRDRALAVFRRLAETEGRVHGVPAEQIHFHEVGALDSIADVVGVCAALSNLGVSQLSAGEVAVGSGEITAAHGRVPVPVPAVTDLARGWRVTAGGRGELTTPTGMALLSTLCAECVDLPALTLHGYGVGAGSKDRPDRANVTRVLVGSPSRPQAGVEAGVLLEANVDDLDPRLWPDVIAQLLDAGASDAWLVPIVMKKGRPAHTLSVLCPPATSERLRELVFRHTSTLGVREHDVRKHVLDRGWLDVSVSHGTVAVKLGHRGGVLVQVSPEFDSVVSVAVA